MIYDFYINNKQINDILTINYNESLDDVASSFNFNSLSDFGITSNENNKTSLNSFKICEKGKKQPFYFGHITDCEHTTDKYIYNYSGFDVGFYLNKNEIVKQFRKANIGEAIKSMCRDYQIDINLTAKFKNSVSKIYKDEVFSDVLKELIELEKLQGGLKNLYIDCKSGKLNILEYKLEENLSAIISNGILIDSHKTINNINIKHSIQELKNKIIIVDNNEQSIKTISKQNDNSISTYGLLASVESVDTKKTNNLNLLAQKKLEESNRQQEDISLTLLGDYRLGKGKIINLKVEEYKLEGLYLIKSANHKIDKDKDEIDITIKKFT